MMIQILPIWALKRMNDEEGS